MTKQVEYQTMQSLPASGFSGSFQLIATLNAPAIIVKVVNNSNADVTISTDGSTDHDFVPGGSFFLYDIRTNHGREQQLAFKIGTKFYVNGASSLSNTGDIYFVALNEGQ